MANDDHRPEQQPDNHSAATSRDERPAEMTPRERKDYERRLDHEAGPRPTKKS